MPHNTDDDDDDDGDDNKPFLTLKSPN